MKYVITAEPLNKIEKVRRENKNKRVENRLKVLVLRGEGKTLAEMAEATGLVITCNDNLLWVKNVVLKWVRQFSLPGEEASRLPQGFVIVP